MVTVPQKIESVEDVIRFIPENDFNWYDRLDKDEIRNGSVCNCGHGKFGRSEDRTYYEADKTAIAICNDCHGFYGIVLPNWH